MATDLNSTSVNHRYTCCCFQITRSDADSVSTWWTKGVRALMKFREWSEVVAGPKWKTFIRRFNRNRSGNVGGRLGGGTFNYDALNYSLNFDDGQGQDSHFDVDEYYGGSRDFSARYAAVPKDGS